MERYGLQRFYMFETYLFKIMLKKSPGLYKIYLYKKKRGLFLL